MSNEHEKHRAEYYAGLANDYVREADRFVPGYLEEMIPSIIDSLYVPEGAFIADLGCGPGNISAEVFEDKRPRKMYWVDSSIEMVAKARQIAEGMEISPEIICSNIESVTFDTELDGAFSSLVIHNISYERKEEILNKIYSSLKKGGVFVWADLVHFDNHIKQESEVEFRKKYALERGADPVFVEENFKKEGSEDYPLRVDEMIVLLEQVGFVDIKVVWERTTFVTIRAIKP